VRGTWHPVVRANRKTLTVPTWMGRGRNEPGPDGRYPYTDTMPYSNVFGRRRDGRVLHTPPPPAGTGCNILVGGPSGSDSIVECADLELWARLTTRHEAGLCSCHPTSPERRTSSRRTRSGSTASVTPSRWNPICQSPYRTISGGSA
jgi:hypothetical protein